MLGVDWLVAVGFVLDEVDQAGLATVGLEHRVGVGAVTGEEFLHAVGSAQ